MWSYSCSFSTSPNFILYRYQSKHNINITNKTNSEWNDKLQLYFCRKSKEYKYKKSIGYKTQMRLPLN